MSRLKTGLALIGASVALTGAIGIGAESANDKNAKENAALAEACYETYGYTDKIGTQTIDCMKEGWVPQAGSIDTSQFRAGDPPGLLKGYVRIEKERAQGLDPTLPILYGLFGFAGGLLLASVTLSEGQVKTKEETGSSESTAHHQV